MRALFITASGVLISLAAFAAVPQHAPNGTSAKGETPRTGEQVFHDNCARCHQPPMSLSPRITGTVIMHMRVRARLSGKDEQLLLKYLAP